MMDLIALRARREEEFVLSVSFLFTAVGLGPRRRRGGGAAA